MNFAMQLTRMVEDMAHSPALALERRIEAALASQEPDKRDRLMLVYDERQPHYPPALASSLTPLSAPPTHPSPEAFLADAMQHAGSVFPTWMMAVKRVDLPVQPPVRSLLNGVDDSLRTLL